MIIKLLGIPVGALCAASAMLVLATPSFADVSGRTNNSNPTTITDANATGVFSTVTIMENEIIEDISFCIEGLNHTWAGDLVATLTHVDGDASTPDTVATLFGRIGKGSSAGNGDSSNFVGDYIFTDATNNNLWSEAGRGSTDYDIRNTTFDAGDPQTNPGAYRTSLITTGAVTSFSEVFRGESTAGLWVFNISDRNATQEGTYDNVEVKFVSSPAVPEPGTAGLGILACAMFGIARRRRKRVSIAS